MSDQPSTTPSPGLIDRLRGAVRALRPQVAELKDAPNDADVPDMLGEIGVTLLAASEATSEVEATLKRLAVQYGRLDLRIFVLPTLVLIESPAETGPTTAIFPANRPALRLDQSGSVERVVRKAFGEQQDPQSVVDALTAISLRPPRFGATAAILGHMLLTVGFGLVLNPTLTALPVYVVLGLFVGAIVRVGHHLPTLALVLPVATAFAVTGLVTILARVGHSVIHDDVIRLVAPALVSFLPGLTLTIAAVELTSGQVIAGASRLVYGIARLGLLAFGVYAGLTVAGSASASNTASESLGEWAPWVGLLLVSLGYFLYSAAPRGSLLWILYALIVAHSAQLLGHLLVGVELSGLIGALIVIPAVHLAARLKLAPSSAIMLTCAYWVLVPGSMGFIGLSEVASGRAGAVSALLETAGSLIAIAIGMMLGAALSRDATAVARGWRSPGGRRRTKARSAGG